MIMKFLGANEFLPQNKIIRLLAKYGCELTEAERYICENTVFVLCGFDKEQYNAVSTFFHWTCNSREQVMIVFL